MKRLFLFIAFTTSVSLSMAQLVVKTKCPDITVDILDGKVNGIKSNAPDYDIKKAIPCFTSSEPDNSKTKCGGGVFYKDKDIYFYTDRDYIQIGEKFKGKISMPLMGAKRGTFSNKLGNPKLSDDTWDAWQMQYGTLVLHYNKLGRVNLIEMSVKTMDILSLCQ